MPKTKISICQIVVFDDDRDGNMVRIKNAIAESKQKNADIACFPEMCFYGWVNPEAHHRASTIPGVDSDWICSISAQYDIHICISLAEKDGKNLYDSAILTSNQGKILLKHRKINLLSELMEPPYTPGKDVETVETEFGTIGILICADTFKDTLLQRMKTQKPDLLLVPYGWAENSSKFPQHGQKMAEVVANAAKMVGCPVIGTDCVGMIQHGPWKNRVYGGQSVASDAQGNILIQLKDRDRDLQIIDIEAGSI